MNKICTCGDSEDQHVDNEGPCVIADCRCRSFIEDELKSECPECGGREGGHSTGCVAVE